MSKKEFLDRLENALLEQMDIREAAPHIRYYQDYIENEVRKGRDEEEVVNSLNNPRLIAKTLIDNGVSANKYNNNIYGTHGKDYEDSSASNSYNGDGRITFSINGKPINSLWLKIISIVLFFIVVMLVVLIISGVMWLFFRVILPFFIVGVAVCFIVKLIKGKL